MSNESTLQIRKLARHSQRRNPLFNYFKKSKENQTGENRQMKKTILIICLLAISTIVMFPFRGVPQATATDDRPSVSSENQVVAYYFHGTFRCSSCLKIEQYSKEAIEKYFGNELKSGKLVFKAVNVEEKGYEHYINDYQLYTKSLVLSLVKNGKETKSDNLVKVWEYLGNREKFYEYVKINMDSYLGEL